MRGLAWEHCGNRLKADKGCLNCAHPCLEMVDGNVNCEVWWLREREKECGGGGGTNTSQSRSFWYTEGKPKRHSLWRIFMADHNVKLQLCSPGQDCKVLPMCFQLSMFEVALDIYLWRIYCTERLKFVLVRSLGLVWGWVRGKKGGC